MLSHWDRPSSILVTDADMTRQKKAFDCAAVCLFQGTTVDRCESFTGMAHVNELDLFFAKLGLFLGLWIVHPEHPQLAASPSRGGLDEMAIGLPSRAAKIPSL